MQKPIFFDARPALIAAQALNGTDRERFSIAVFDALWSGNIKPDHDGWVEEVMQQSGLPGEWGTPDNPEQCMTELRENTKTAYKAGAFGAPTFIPGAWTGWIFWHRRLVPQPINGNTLTTSGFCVWPKPAQTV